MPEKQSSQAQTSQNSKNTWWIPAIIGILLLMIPGGVFISPAMFILAVVLRRRKPKSPETPSLLFQFTLEWD